MASHLEPCPFCGSSNMHINRHLLSRAVCCQHCKGSGPHKKQLEDAITEWNLTARLLFKARRSESVRVYGRLHELEDAVRNLATELRCV